jgi:predicted kinase
MSQLTLTKGLPASGKTTWALGWQSESPTIRKIVCRDDIRAALSNEECALKRARDKNIESTVSTTSLSQVENYLTLGMDVCVADTNLNEGTVKRYTNIADKLSVPVQFQDFTAVPLVECLKRDAKRACGRVGETVIISMWERYLRDSHNVVKHYYSDMKQHCIVSDIDGTIADNTHRNPYNYAKLSLDAPITFTKDLLGTQHFLMKDMVPVFYVSGRPDTYHAATYDWLKTHNFPLSNNSDLLLMRKADDRRPDYIVKEEIAKYIMEQYNILWWLDDRWTVSAHLRSIGINILQVAFGRF